MTFRLHKFALIILTTLSIASVSADNVSVEQPEIPVQEENIPEKLLALYRSLIQKCAQLTAKTAEMQQFIEDQEYNHKNEIDALEKKLKILQEAYEQALFDNETLQAELYSLTAELNSKNSLP